MGIPIHKDDSSLTLSMETSFEISGNNSLDITKLHSQEETAIDFDIVGYIENILVEENNDEQSVHLDFNPIPFCQEDYEIDWTDTEIIFSSN